MKKYIISCTVMLLGALGASASEFASPAAESSFRQSGNTAAMPGLNEQADAIRQGADSIFLAARSATCSTRCSTTCSTSCSSGCSARCGGGSRSSGGFFSGITKRSSSPSTSSPEPPKRKEIEFWVTEEKVVHNPSCDQYKKGEGRLTKKPEGTNCEDCGGTKKRKKPAAPAGPPVEYWVTKDGVIHGITCDQYRKGEGELTTDPKGVNCKNCGGKH